MMGVGALLSLEEVHKCDPGPQRQRLFALSENSYRLYLHYVKIARRSAIYTTYCK